MSQTGQSASISVAVTGLTGSLALSAVFTGLTGALALSSILTDAVGAPLLDASNNPLTTPTYFTGQTAAQIA